MTGGTRTFGGVVPFDSRPYAPAMPARFVITALLAVVLAACGGSGGAASSAGPSVAGGQPSTGDASPTTASGGSGSVDCAKLATAAQQLLAVQLLAQLNSPDGIEAIKTRQLGNLDLDAFLAAMHDLHALDSYSSPLGDPKTAIAVYEKAGSAAKVLFATDPVTQAAIDTYHQNVGTLGAFLGQQAAISGAMDAAGC